MAVEIKMPRLSQTTDEVRFIRWLVHEGETVKKGDPLCEVETDKVTMEVESFTGGRVLELITRPDTTVDAGTVIAVLGGPKEKPGKKHKIEENGSKHQSDKTDETVVEETLVEETVSGEGNINGQSGSSEKKTTVLSGDVRATPLVRNISRKRGIDLRLVQATGPGGLVTKRDLELFEKQTAMPETAGKPAAPAGGAPSRPVGRLQDVSGEGAAGETIFELSPSQAAVARNMARSKSVIPHYYLKTAVYADHMIEYIEKSRDRTDGKLSVYSLFIYAAAGALRAHPELNGFFRKDPVRAAPVRAGRVIRMKDIHIGFAVESGPQLFVPVVRDADRKVVGEIDREVKQLAVKAKSGKLEPHDVRGGTFTVTNLGIYPVDEFYAIINYPQLGILAMSRIGKTIFIDDDNTMKIRNIFTVTGSFDHRCINGALGAKFLQTFKQIMEGVKGV